MSRINAEALRYVAVHVGQRVARQRAGDGPLRIEKLRECYDVCSDRMFPPELPDGGTEAVGDDTRPRPGGGAVRGRCGGPPPRTVPVPLAERMMGWFTAFQLTRMRGASNARAAQHLGWTPTLPTWRTLRT